MSQTPGSPSPGSAAAGDDGQISMEWELGLPSTSDLTPLSHSLISQTLAAAFNISPEPSRSAADLNRASHSTLLNLQNTANRNPNPNSNFPNFNNVDKKDDDDDVEEIEDERWEKGVVVVEEDEEEEQGGRRGRRLVWTPQLHKRFVDVVGHIGIKNTVPKTIMQMMNVEGLTRENVASHLQKYRLYLKRMQGLSPRRTSEGGDQQEEGSSSQRGGGGGMGHGNVTGMMIPMMMGMGGYGGGQQQQQLQQYHHQYGVMQQNAWNGYHRVHWSSSLKKLYGVVLFHSKRLILDLTDI
ncbi:Transcription factor BOA-like protein [Drosera capensis]